MTIEPGLPPTTRQLADGSLDHPECAIWDADGQCLIAGGEDGQLYRVALDGSGVDLVAHRKGSFFLGLALDARGDVFACDLGSGGVIRVTREGAVERYGAQIGTPNYPVFDARGTLYVTRSGTHNGNDGGIVRIRPGGITEVLPLTRPLAFANGLALRGDDLYVAESDAARVVRVTTDGGEPETVAELPGTVPDGLAFDTEGALWITSYQPNRIYRLAANGDLEVVADDPGGWVLPMPTNVCFAGDDLATVVAACLGGWGLVAFEAPCPGVAPFRPDLATGAPS